MNELHLFAGGGGGIIGGMLLGHTCVCAVEIEPYCRKILFQRQRDGILPKFPIWDDVKTFNGYPWRGKVDVVCGGFPCFIGGTNILTTRGYISIEDITTEDYVLTHLGRWKRVTSTMQRNNIFLRKIDGHGILETITTDEHPYYTRTKCQDKKRAITYTEPEWTKSKNIIPTKHMLSHILPPEREDNHTKEWWWLVGRYLADGWRVDRKNRKNGRVVICCNRKESEEIGKKITEAGFNYTQVSERTVDKFHITIGIFYQELAEFGRGARYKKLPINAMCLNQEKSKALFDGWITGDGYWNKKQKMWSGSTTSKTLALGMAMVAQRAIGTIAGIYYTNMPEKCIIEGRIVNQHTQYCVRILHKNCGSFIEGKYSWKRISKNESYGTGTVFNISVEDDESYIANGAIVHNCQDISAAGKGKGIKGERSGLWTEFARIISEIQPSFVFLENSPMLLQRGIEIVLGDLSCLGYNARWGIISASDAGFNHLRKRFWCLGYSSKIRFTPIQLSDEIIRPESLNILSSRIYSTLIQDEDFSRNFRNDDGMANWVERFAAIGNGQVPAVVELAWKILNSELKPVQSIAESKHKNKLPNKIKKHNFGKLIKQGE